MENLVVCLNAVLPIFLLIVAGYIARRCGLLSEEDVRTFNKVAFQVFLPVTVFSNIYSSDLSSAVRPRLIGFTVVAVLAVIALSTVFALLAVKERSRQGVVIQGLFRSNLAILGVPLASSLMDGGDISAVVVLTAVIVPLYNAMAVVCLAIFGGKQIRPGKIAVQVLKNPLIIGSVLGLLFLGLGIRLPAAVASTVKSAAGVASPLMLILLGGFFRFGSLKEQKRELIFVCLGRLLLIPAVCLGLAWRLGFQGVEMAGLVAVFASSTAVASFTMAQQMGGDSELAGDIVVATSALCPFTIFFWCMLLKILGAL